MKTSKLESILFSLITVATFSIFLSSCEKPNSVVDERINYITNQNNTKDILLPKEIN